MPKTILLTKSKAEAIKRLPISLHLNAFIPRNVDCGDDADRRWQGGTTTLSRGRNKGRSAIYLPTLNEFSNVSLWKFGHLMTRFSWPRSAYLTDQRRFSADPIASSRVQSVIEFDGLNGDILKRGRHRTSGTTEVYPGQSLPPRSMNAQLRGSWAGPFHHEIRRGSSESKATTHQWRLDLRAEGSDPFVRGADKAGPIRYEGRFIVTVVVSEEGLPSTVTVTFRGNVATFPAYEAYLTVDNHSVAIFQLAPPEGKGVSVLSNVWGIGWRRAAAAGLGRLTPLSLNPINDPRPRRVLNSHPAQIKIRYDK